MIIPQEYDESLGKTTCRATLAWTAYPAVINELIDSEVGMTSYECIAVITAAYCFPSGAMGMKELSHPRRDCSV